MRTTHSKHKFNFSKAQFGPRHANTDTHDAKKGKGVQFRIHKRQSAEEATVDIPLSMDDQIYVWHGNNRHLRLRAKLAIALIIAMGSAVTAAAVSLNTSEAVTKIVTHTDGRILSAAMEVNPDLMAAALNEINVGAEQE